MSRRRLGVTATTSASSSICGHGTSVVPLDPAAEYAVGGRRWSGERRAREIGPGGLAYLGMGRDELALTVTATGRGLLIGGIPLDQPLLMWWNFVARTARRSRRRTTTGPTAGERFGTVDSRLPRITTTPPLWHPRTWTDDSIQFVVQDEPGSGAA